MIILFLLSSIAAAFELTSLTVENLAAPPLPRSSTASLVFALDAERPRFGWHLARASTPQVSYRILVTCAQSSSQCADPFFDSGVVPSNATTQIVYTGRALLPDADFGFSVTATTADGSSATATGSFSTGLYTPADWRGAEWVGGGGILRSTLELPKGPVIRRAVAHATGVGMYELCVNGVRVNALPDGRTSRLNPGFSTVFSKRVLYNSWDILSLLQGGSNVVGIRVGEGKYGYLGEFCVGGPLQCNAAILSLNVEMDNGENVTLRTSPDGWLAGPSSISQAPLLYSLYNGEQVDARIGDPSWCNASFNPGSNWEPALPRASPTSELSSHAFPPISSWEPSRTAISVAPVPGDSSSFIFSFENNGAAMCALRLPHPLEAGRTITLRFAEQTSSESVINGLQCPSKCCADGGNCANQTYSYITRGGELAEIFEMSFAYPAFKFVQLIGWPGSQPPGLSDLTCEPTSTAVGVAGSVYFNDTILDGVQSMIVRSQRANFHSIPTDCPHREKRG